MPPRRALLPAAGLTLALASAPACASRYTVPASPPTYAADAKIRVKLTRTGIRQLHIKLVHLAPLHRIDTSYRAYVVWISVPGQGINRAGSLKYSDHWRTGKLVATTPHPKFEVIVSIEQNPSASQPSDKVIIRKVVSKI